MHIYRKIYYDKLTYWGCMYIYFYSNSVQFSCEIYFFKKQENFKFIGKVWHFKIFTQLLFGTIGVNLILTNFIFVLEVCFIWNGTGWSLWLVFRFFWLPLLSYSRKSNEGTSWERRCYALNRTHNLIETLHSTIKIQFKTTSTPNSFLSFPYHCLQVFAVYIHFFDMQTKNFTYMICYTEYIYKIEFEYTSTLLLTEIFIRKL